MLVGEPGQLRECHAEAGEGEDEREAERGAADGSHGLPVRPMGEDEGGERNHDGPDHRRSDRIPARQDGRDDEAHDHEEARGQPDERPHASPPPHERDECRECDHQHPQREGARAVGDEVGGAVRCHVRRHQQAVTYVDDDADRVVLGVLPLDHGLLAAAEPHRDALIEDRPGGGLAPLGHLDGEHLGLSGFGAEGVERRGLEPANSRRDADRHEQHDRDGAVGEGMGVEE